MIGLPSSEIIGSKCYKHFKTSHCNTPDCACSIAMREGEKVIKETEAHPNNLNLEIQYTGVPIRDENKKIIGVLEFAIDQTAIKKAARIAEKQAEYQENEVNKLIVNLDELSKGIIQCNTSVALGDNDTKYIRENFVKINQSLDDSIQAIKSLVIDANVLVTAATEGKLSFRADASKHGGEFRKVVEGINKTLDAVIEPIQEASIVLQEISKGNLQVNVKGNYKGEHAAIKDSLNYTAQSISQYINEISNVLNHISEGNFDVGINVEYFGDFIEIKDSLNKIINVMNETMLEINNAADQVAAGSRQVSDGSQQLSQCATEQASATEQLTASMEQISSQTKKNALNANQVSEFAVIAKDSALKGTECMTKMLKSMQDIDESSVNISKIIKVIDAIAFQTNILSLNAAVEAARAGENGKGFAVVAEEVRNLAIRSADAAKETEMLIEGSIKKVEGGIKIADETAESLNKILEKTIETFNLVVEIAKASNEQATGIGEVNSGIDKLAQVTQINASTAQESAAASEELSNQVILLKEMVGKFKLKRDLGVIGMESRMRLNEKEKVIYPKTSRPVDKRVISLGDKDQNKYFSESV